MGRISKEKDADGTVLKSYTYDQYGQLWREDNKALDKSYVYGYNNIGNLVSVETYAYTTGTLGSVLDRMSLGYDTTHPDRLTTYDCEGISYDANGCPTNYDGYTASWTRGKLSKLEKTIGSATYTYRYSYNALGQRVGMDFTGLPMGYSKTFCYDQSGRLICENKADPNHGWANSTEKIVYLYDESGMIGMIRTASGVSSTYYFQRNLFGDVIGIYNTSGTKVGGYAYDAWGNCTITLDTGGIATANPIRYRGYYYDKETKLYYLNARYYCPAWRRFFSPDDTAYLDPESPNGLNLYAYCYNDPVSYTDCSGHAADFILDLFFIGWDIYNLSTNGGWKDWKNWAALVVDVGFAVVPFVTGGSGQIVKLSNVEDISDFNKITVVGETMTRVKTVSQFVNAADNLYDGFKAYDRLKYLGKGGKVLAEIGGKAHNLGWLYGKLRKGYTIVDIGIDIGRVSNKTGKLARSSSYFFERLLLTAWKYRNIWKLPYHIF